MDKVEQAGITPGLCKFALERRVESAAAVVTGRTYAVHSTTRLWIV